MKKLNFIIVFSLVFFAQVIVRAEVGTENRVKANDGDPWMEHVGRIISGCTATLIGDYILTAAHCRKPVMFCLQARTLVHDCPSDKLYKVLNSVAGVHAPDLHPDARKDWIIYKLDRKGPAARINFTKPYIGMRVTLPGYPTMLDEGRIPYVHKDCQITGILDGKIYTDCDATIGNSGGPLLYCNYGTCDIIGIQSQANDKLSISCSVENFKDQISKLPGVVVTDRRYVVMRSYARDEISRNYSTNGSHYPPATPQPSYSHTTPTPRYQPASTPSYRNVQREAEQLLERTKSLLER